MLFGKKSSDMSWPKEIINMNQQTDDSANNMLFSANANDDHVMRTTILWF